jgi:oxepin-CoA hydrolase/3-oxo-5,6-dehydrosuberyl-CoA semialdehyde dehydrogenase
VTIFCQTKQIFVGRSSATVKKICEVWRKMGLFGPDRVPTNQLQKIVVFFGQTACHLSPLSENILFTMKQLQNFTLGEWQSPIGTEVLQYNAYNHAVIGVAGDVANPADVFDYGRNVGSRNLRKMTFFERGLMLKHLAMYLTDRKEHYYSVSHLTGATRLDSWIDIDGGIGNLFAYASLRRQMGSEHFYVDGATVPLSKEGTFVGQHIMVPKRGVALHINAFNFPVWGMLEKCAVNWLAGMAAVVKASEVTSFVTEAVVRDIEASGILPKGALQFLGGRGHGLLDYLENQDVVSFTGSAETGKRLKAHPRLLEHSIPFNLEADSLNAMVLGEDGGPGTPEFDIFIKNVRAEMTVKAGQKCTAVRRIMVPAPFLEAVQIQLGKELSKVKVGDPSVEGVRMGALVSQTQRERVLTNLGLLCQSSTLVFGDLDQYDVVGADKTVGAFLPPLLLLNVHPFDGLECHNIEAFGPVATLMPYENLEQAIELVQLGKGSLVSTICTHDAAAAGEFVREAGAYNGRILILDRESAKESTGHGSPMPMLTHGGPGRAGGGEEMGGLRGVMHYLQRVAVQGHPTMLTAVSKTYQRGGARPEVTIHPFRQYFEYLRVGDTLTTANHTVSEADISNFANVSGDNFYAHMDVTSLEGTPFTGRVAHGYFILSKAAGLFVDAKKGPVLLNYGLDECRFTKPVYPGMTIGVRLTVKEKIETEQRVEDTLPPRGIVRWLVDVYDETGETVALATILTMVRKKTV